MYDLKKIEKIADDIKTITIQGATNIAREACKIMESETRFQKFSDKKELKDFFDKATSLLIEARETEPMLRNAMKYARSKLNEGLGQKDIADAFLEYLVRIEEEETIRPDVGAEIISDGENIVTHCHSGSVVKTLIHAWKDGKKIHVYNTETRPLYQGRKTSQELLKAGVTDTMITDSGAPFFVDNIYGSHVNIDKIFVGADSIRTNGDTINKVGSFSISLSASHSGIPFYVVGSLLKIDLDNSIGIETRSGKELWPDAPEGLDILNYAFDMIPGKFITGFITEFGIIKPEKLMDEIEIRYPWMLK